MLKGTLVALLTVASFSLAACTAPRPQAVAVPSVTTSPTETPTPAPAPVSTTTSPTPTKRKPNPVRVEVGTLKTGQKFTVIIYGVDPDGGDLTFHLDYAGKQFSSAKDIKRSPASFTQELDAPSVPETKTLQVFSMNNQGLRSDTVAVPLEFGDKPTPGTVKGISSTSETLGTVRLDWPVVEYADRYKIKRTRRSSDGSPPKIFEARSNSFVDTGLELGQRYDYILTAMNDKGLQSSESDIVTIEVGGLPGRVSNINGATLTGGNGIQITFDKAEFAESYKVTKREGSGDTRVLFNSLKEVMFVDADVSAGRNYTYGITGKTADGKLGQETTISVAVGGLTVPNFRVVALRNAERTDNGELVPPDKGLEISWDPADPNVKEFAVYIKKVSTPAEAWSKALGGIDPRKGRVIVPGLQNDIEYIVTLEARGGLTTTVLPPETTIEGLRSNSRVASAKVTAAKPAPGQPASPTIIQDATNPHTTLRVTLRPVENATSFDLLRSTSRSGTYQEIARSMIIPGDLSDMSRSFVFVDSGLASGMGFFYKVVAINDRGRSPESVEGFGSTAQCAPTGFACGATPIPSNPPGGSAPTPIPAPTAVPTAMPQLPQPTPVPPAQVAPTQPPSQFQGSLFVNATQNLLTVGFVLKDGKISGGVMEGFFPSQVRDVVFHNYRGNANGKGPKEISASVREFTSVPPKVGFPVGSGYEGNGYFRISIDGVGEKKVYFKLTDYEFFGTLFGVLMNQVGSEFNIKVL